MTPPPTNVSPSSSTYECLNDQESIRGQESGSNRSSYSSSNTMSGRDESLLSLALATRRSANSRFHRNDGRPANRRLLLVSILSEALALVDGEQWEDESSSLRASTLVQTADTQQ